MSKPKRTVDLSYIAKPLHRYTVPIDSIVPDPDNARLHGEQNSAATRASLIERGQTLPITVRLANKTVMTGNKTLELARSLGWTQSHGGARRVGL